MSWTNAYIGIPFLDLGRDKEGCDCWGLVRLVYRQELGIDVPSYAGDYHSTEERQEIARLIGAAQCSPSWRKVENPQAFDVVLFRRGLLTAHIGIVMRPDWMLHMHDAGARIENYRLTSWQSRFLGCYRHEKL